MAIPAKTMMTQTAATVTPKKAKTSMPSPRTMFSTRTKTTLATIIMLRLTLMEAMMILRRVGVGSMGMMFFDSKNGVEGGDRWKFCVLAWRSGTDYELVPRHDGSISTSLS